MGLPHVRNYRSANEISPGIHRQSPNMHVGGRARSSEAVMVRKTSTLYKSTGFVGLQLKLPIPRSPNLDTRGKLKIRRVQKKLFGGK